MGIRLNGNSASWEFGEMGIQLNGNSAQFQDTMAGKEVIHYIFQFSLHFSRGQLLPSPDYVVICIRYKKLTVYRSFYSALTFIRKRHYSRRQCGLLSMDSRIATSMQLVQSGVKSR